MADQSIVARITHDLIAQSGEEKRNGVAFHGAHALTYHPVVKFRMKDDDGEIYYRGWLHDDPHSNVQSDVLEWGKADAGCTTIEIYSTEQHKWIQEIG